VKKENVRDEGTGEIASRHSRCRQERSQPGQLDAVPARRRAQFMGSPTRNLAIDIQFASPRLIESTVSDHAGRRKHLPGYNRASILRRGAGGVRRIFPWQRRMEGQCDRLREQLLNVSTSGLGPGVASACTTDRPPTVLQRVASCHRPQQQNESSLCLVRCRLSPGSCPAGRPPRVLQPGWRLPS
jgi:hypothetical protein